MNCANDDKCTPAVLPNSPLVEDPEDLNEEMNQLMAELERLQNQRQTDLDRAKQLAREELETGVSHASAIFTAKQNSLMLATQAQHCRVRINHLRYQLGLPFLGGD